MTSSETIETLPDTRRLSAPQQRRVLVMVVAGLIALWLLISAVRWLTTPAAPAAPAPATDGLHLTPQQLAGLTVQRVGTGTDPDSLVVTGTISVDEEHSTPIVLPYSGQVGTVYVEAGEHVAQGQPLLRIASSDFVEARDQLLSAAAARATAIAQLATAQETAKRAELIFKTAGGAQKDYVQARGDLVAAQSAARSADAALAAARDKLALFGQSAGAIARAQSGSGAMPVTAATVYRSPVAGTVATRAVAPGQYVSAGGDAPLMTISDLSRVWLIAQVPESDAARVHLGDRVRVTTPAFPGREFDATIDNIGATLDPQTHRLPVRASVNNPGEALKPQMFASFSIVRQGQGSNALLVPAEAVIREGDAARVWVIDRAKVLHARPVTIVDSGNGFVRIGSGLEPGERVVTRGAIFVNEAGLDG